MGLISRRAGGPEDPTSLSGGWRHHATFEPVGVARLDERNLAVAPGLPVGSFGRCATSS
jgi:hypothetical protein